MRRKYQMPEELRGQLGQLVLSAQHLSGVIEGLETARNNLLHALHGLLLREYPDLDPDSPDCFDYSIVQNCFYADMKDAE